MDDLDKSKRLSDEARTAFIRLQMKCLTVANNESINDPEQMQLFQRAFMHGAKAMVEIYQERRQHESKHKTEKDHS
jgi:ferric iron reductase protein FhuF